MYLDNLGEKEDEFFTYSTTESIISDLKKIETIRIPSIANVQTFSKSNLPDSEIGRRLQVDKIIKGRANLEDIKTLESIPKMISESTICAFGDAAAMPVESFIKHYKNEFLKYIKVRNKSKDEILNFHETDLKKEFVIYRK